MNFIIVALGGALGALGRYSISLIPVKTTFPLLTFITNILGAILIGFIVGLTDKRKMFRLRRCYSGKQACVEVLQHFQLFRLRHITCLRRIHIHLDVCIYS